MGHAIDGVATDMLDSIGLPEADTQIETTIQFLNGRYRDLDLTHRQLVKEAVQIKADAARDAGTIIVMAVNNAFGGFEEFGMTPRESIIERRKAESDIRGQQLWLKLGQPSANTQTASKAQRLQSLRSWNETR